MRYFTKFRLAALCLILPGLLSSLFLLRPGRAQVASYTVTDLGSLGGLRSEAYAINNSGRVAGISTKSSTDTSPDPFAWMGGVMSDVGSFGGLDGGTAVSVNEVGYVVGGAATSTGDTHPFIWSDVFGKKDLGTLGGVFATASDINDANQVVGVSEKNQFTDRGFVWDSVNGMREITTLGGNASAARGINNLGQIVGSSSNAAGQTHAFLLSGGVMTDLGTLGTGTFSLAYEINDNGQVVGYSNITTGSISPPFHAFVYTQATGMVDLGTLGGNRSIAYDINLGGEVVGYAETAPGIKRAFIWDNLNGMRDLNTLTFGSNWTLLEARGINNKGQIVGFGTNPSGFTHAFLLTPISDVIPGSEPPPCAIVSSPIVLPQPQSVTSSPKTKRGEIIPTTPTTPSRPVLRPRGKLTQQDSPLRSGRLILEDEDSINPKREP